MTSSDRPPSRPLRPGRGRLLVATATVIAVVAIGLTIDLPRSRQGHEPASPGPSGSAAAGGPVGLWAAELPKVDPGPWTAVTWHVVPGAIVKRPVLGLDRIDGLIPGGPGLIGWGRVSQPGRNQFNDMAAIDLSATGVVWTVVALDAGVGPADASEIQLIAPGPAGIVVIGDVCCTGEERPAMWRSADGIAWQRLPFPAEIAGPELIRMIATRDRYVVGGRRDGRAQIWSSADGVAWRAAGHAADEFGRGSIEDVTATANGLVAAGWVEDDQGRYDGMLWTSPDGGTWTRQPIADLAGEPDTIVSRVVPWTGGTLLIGQEGDHAERMRCEQAGSTGPVQPPAPGSRDFSCGWGDEVHWVSRDGVPWQRIVPAGARAAPAKAGELIEFRLLSAGGPGLVTLGEGLDDGGASIFVSSDGIRWRPTQPRPQWPPGVVPSGFVVRGRTIVGVGDGASVEIGTVR